MMSIQNKPSSRLVFQTELDQICWEKNTESIHSLIGDYQLTVRSWSGFEFIIHRSHSQSPQIDVQKLKNYVLEVCILICLNHTKSPDWPLCGEEQDIICIIWRFFKDLDDFSDIITGNDWNSVHRSNAIVCWRILCKLYWFGLSVW